MSLAAQLASSLKPHFSLRKALDIRVFFLRLSEIFPGLVSLQGPGEKQLGSRVPEKDGGVKRENIFVMGFKKYMKKYYLLPKPHTTFCVCMFLKKEDK